MKTGDSPTTEKLREALIKSVEIARAGQKEKPPVDPPARLKQFLAFRKFPERALNQVREVVETDEEFRERVVAAIKEEDVSRVGWLWLVRPKGGNRSVRSWPRWPNRSRSRLLVLRASWRWNRSCKEPTVFLRRSSVSGRRLTKTATRPNPRLFKPVPKPAKLLRWQAD